MPSGAWAGSHLTGLLAVAVPGLHLDFAGSHQRRPALASTLRSARHVAALRVDKPESGRAEPSEMPGRMSIPAPTPCSKGEGQSPGKPRLSLPERKRGTAGQGEDPDPLPLPLDSLLLLFWGLFCKLNIKQLASFAWTVCAWAGHVRSAFRLFQIRFELRSVSVRLSAGDFSSVTHVHWDLQAQAARSSCPARALAHWEQRDSHSTPMARTLLSPLTGRRLGPGFCGQGPCAALNGTVSPAGLVPVSCLAPQGEVGKWMFDLLAWAGSQILLPAILKGKSVSSTPCSQGQWTL